MSADADVVRCAAPWPGRAAQVVDAMASLGPGPWNIARICAATGIDPGDAVQVLTSLAVAGVCQQCNEDDHWRTLRGSTELHRLVAVLRGADHYRRLRLDAQSVEVAVTMPMAPSFLEPQLSSAPGWPGGYLPTTEAFLRVARAARAQLVVLSPFLDGRGFEWLRRVMEACSHDVAKIFVLRDADQYAAELGVNHADWLHARAITVMDYHLSHGTGRALPVETFHAKIVLADEHLAYVGSANILGSGGGTSLEAGILVDGRAAAQVARLVSGILRVARRL